MEEGALIKLSFLFFKYRERNKKRATFIDLINRPHEHAIKFWHIICLTTLLSGAFTLIVKCSYVSGLDLCFRLLFQGLKRCLHEHLRGPRTPDQNNPN